MPSADGWLLADKHRRAQALLASQVSGDVSRAWPLLDPHDLDRSFPRYATALGTTTRARRSISEGLARGFYRTLRADEGVTGSLTMAAAPALVPERILTSLRVTGPVAWKRALSRGADPMAASRIAQGATTRSLTRHVLDGGRGAVLSAMMGDDKAHGYMRVSDGKPCAFCAMLVSRGAVYKAEATADFKSHDGCGCGCVPFWEATPAHSRQAESFGDLWARSGARFSGARALAEFRRAYEAEHAPGPRRDRPSSGTRVPEPPVSITQQATNDALAPLTREPRTPWKELSKAETIARVEARHLANAEERLAKFRAQREFWDSRVKTTQKSLDNATEGWLRTTYESRLTDAAKSLTETTDAIAAIERGDLDAAIKSAITKRATTHRVFESDGNEFWVRKTSAKSAGVTDDAIATALRDFDDVYDRLPEWRRLTDTGERRTYEIVVDGMASKSKAAAYTYRGNQVVWMNPRYVAEAGKPFPKIDGDVPNPLLPKTFMPAQYSGRYSEFHYTIAHEIGHTVDHYDNEKATGILQKVFSEARAMTANGTPGRLPDAYLSTYGRSKAAEAYAETFAEWMLGDRTNPIVRLYDEAFGWSLSSADYTGVWKGKGLAPRLIQKEGHL